MDENLLDCDKQQLKEFSASLVPSPSLGITSTPDSNLEGLLQDAEESDVVPGTPENAETSLSETSPETEDEANATVEASCVDTGEKHEADVIAGVPEIVAATLSETSPAAVGGAIATVEASCVDTGEKHEDESPVAEGMILTDLNTISEEEKSDALQESTASTGPSMKAKPESGLLKPKPLPNDNKLGISPKTVITQKPITAVTRPKQIPMKSDQIRKPTPIADTAQLKGIHLMTATQDSKKLDITWTPISDGKKQNINVENKTLRSRKAAKELLWQSFNQKVLWAIFIGSIVIVVAVAAGVSSTAKPKRRVTTTVPVLFIPVSTTVEPRDPSVGFFFKGPVYCNVGKLRHDLPDEQKMEFYESKFSEAFTSLQLTPVKSNITSISLLNKYSYKLDYAVSMKYSEVVPELKWYGMDFTDLNNTRFHKQVHIAMMNIVFPLVANKDDEVRCSINKAQIAMTFDMTDLTAIDPSSISIETPREAIVMFHKLIAKKLSEDETNDLT